MTVYAINKGEALYKRERGERLTKDELRYVSEVDRIAHYIKFQCATCCGRYDERLDAWYCKLKRPFCIHDELRRL